VCEAAGEPFGAILTGMILLKFVRLAG